MAEQKREAGRRIRSVHAAAADSDAGVHADDHTIDVFGAACEAMPALPERNLYRDFGLAKRSEETAMVLSAECYTYLPAIQHRQSRLTPEECEELVEGDNQKAGPSCRIGGRGRFMVYMKCYVN